MCVLGDRPITTHLVTLPLLLQMCDDGGAWSDAALRQLEQAGYSDVMRLEGGYAGWGQVRACVRACVFLGWLVSSRPFPAWHSQPVGQGACWPPHH